MAVVKKSIQHCRGDDRVSEDVAPLGKGFIAGDNRRSMFVALTEQLEQPRRRGFIKLHVSKFIDDQQRNVIEMPLFVPGNAVELSGVNLIEKILRRQEVHAETSIATL